MAINMNCVIEINDDKAQLNIPIFIYQGDRGIDLLFSLKYSDNRDIMNDNNIKYSSITIKKPDGTLDGGEIKKRIVDGKVLFNVNRDITETFGTFKLLIHLYDDEGDRFAIPPVEFNVLELEDVDKTGQIIIRYLDQDNIEISEPTVMNDLDFGEYIVYSKKIYGYELIEDI